MTAQLDQALEQIADIERFCDFCEGLPMPPMTMPHDPVRAQGLDPDIWHGLGIVGLWAGLDAFVERRQPAPRSGQLPHRLAAEVSSKLIPGPIVDEMEDMRNLYAHNFGGVADAHYFMRTRPGLRRGGCTLASGHRFDGNQLALTLSDLRFYINAVRGILLALDGAWP